MRVLLDTSFVLPVLGVEVKGTESSLERLSSHEVFFSEISMLEALWVLKKMSKSGTRVDMKRVKEGLLSLSGFKRVKTPLRVFYLARLNQDRHRDMIDLTLYFTALSLNMKFLTLDKELERIDDKGVIIHDLPP